MRRAWLLCVTAVRFAFVEHARNRMALVLIIVFVPVWISLVRSVVADTPVRFLVRSAGEMMRTNGNHLTQVSGALQALALIVGFMMYTATGRSAEFDRRLVMAGYPRRWLLLAKVTALVTTAAAVAAYATAWLRFYWSPQQWPLMAAGLFSAALAYGCFGILLATVVRHELAGMFLLIMVSFIDVGVQNPIANPAANSGTLRFLPTYGAMQSAMAATGLTTVPWRFLALELAWAAAAATAGLAVFAWRTRGLTHRAAGLAPSGEATATGVGKAAIPEASPAGTVGTGPAGLRTLVRLVRGTNRHHH